MYKPPKGKISKCIEFLNEILACKDIVKKEIWILGDFNTDFLKRNNVHSVALQMFSKKAGLRQCINDITRPNVRGGSCIDLIMNNSPFICESGVDDDMIADHFTVFCTRKKGRERKGGIDEVVRDYSKFKKEAICNLLDTYDCNEFDLD